MRYSFILITLLIISFSCKTPLSVSSVQMENISNQPSSFSDDSAIVRLVAPYRQSLEEDMSEVLAISSEELSKAKPESKLSNFVADLLMNSGKSYCRMNNKAFSPDMAFVNYGGLRTSLPRGEVTVGKIYELMPFENEMVLLKLPGATMMKFLKQVAARGGDGIAGVKLGIQADSSISSLQIGGRTFNEAQDYWLVTNDYIAGGGDAMTMLAEATEYLGTGLRIRDLIIDSLKQNYKDGKRIRIELDGRFYYE